VRGHVKLASLLGILALSLATGLSTAAAKQGSRYRPPVLGTKGMVATESPAAGRVGRDVLERGGNAVDAAVATVFALNVARPQGCGIGGGGFMVYRSATGRTAALDFRETAPRRFTPKVFAKPGLHDDYTGHLTVGVPGTLAGMRAALARYGTRSLAQSIAPAERLAAHGVKVTPAVSASMRENAKRLRKFPTAARQFLRHGRAYPAGATLRQPALARTLATIRRHGTGAFYRGVIARRIDREMDRTRAHPIKGDRALLTARDFARYRAKWRPPLRGTFRGRELVAMPPPTSGGVLILEMLNILERSDNVSSGMSSADTLHRIIEAEKLALADRNAYLADPDFVHAPVATLISKTYAARRAALIDPARAGSPKPGLGPFGRASGPENPKGNTTQVSVMDAAGNAVSLTCTIEQEFGSAVVAPGTGFLLNNEMTDFGDPGSANEPRAGKRPRSSMSPIIASENGRPIDVTGGAGGSRIMMGAFFSVFNRIEYGLDLDHAVDAERVDAVDFTEKKVVHVEQKRLAPGVAAALRVRGQKLDLVGEYDDLPRVQAVGYAGFGGAQRLAVSDSRTENGSYRQR
jgi:gamma-glutamyltranspeptidase / glutathione hydrolase